MTADPQHTAEEAADPTAQTDEPTSELLRKILAGLPNGAVEIGELVVQLRRRSFGGLILLLAILGLIPAVSVLAGIALIVPGLQMLAGYRAPKLPRLIREREVSAQHLQVFGTRMLPIIETLERYVRPRWLLLTSPPVLALCGLVVTGLAIVLLVPLPFSNFPPSVTLICLSLGLMQRDGALILIGLLLTIIALAIGIFVLSLTIESVIPYLMQRFVH